MEPTPLCQLAIKYRTDKTPFLTRTASDPDWVTHGYTPYYDQLLSARRNEIQSVLEIGIAGGASLKMWRDYFSDAIIFGCDNDPKCIFKDDDILCFYLDQSNPDFLKEDIWCHWFEQVDLIIDDGSHKSEDQYKTANALVPFLAPRGIYIIEDVAHPEEVTPHLNAKYEVIDFRLNLLSDDRIIVIKND